MPTHTDGKLAAVMDIVPEHMPDNLLARAWSEDLALGFSEPGRRVKHLSKVSGGPAVKGSLDHSPSSLEPRDELVGRAYRLLSLLIPASNGNHIWPTLAHPSMKPPGT